MTRPWKPKTIKVGDLEFEAPEELRASEQAVREVLNEQGLRFQHQPLRHNEMMSVLKGPGAAPGFEHDPPVVPFVESESFVYWLGLQLKFQLKRGAAEFRSVSLIVVEGPVAGGSKERILRAEWEGAQGEPSGHAQPHWHVYRSALEMPAQLQRFSLAPQIELMNLSDKEVRPEVVQGMPRFHLAMTARWHTGDVHPHYEAPNAEKLGLWLRQCITYTRSQLIYISGKLP